jgi:hypothetical protein
LNGESLSPLRAANYCLCIFNATLKALTDITEEAPGRLRNTTVSEATFNASALNSISDKRSVEGLGLKRGLSIAVRSRRRRKGADIRENVCPARNEAVLSNQFDNREV